jgi:hypothetical protein
MGVPYHEVGVKRLSALVCLGGLAGLIATACVYDPDDRCGPHQEPIDNDRCVCEAGYVPGDGGCVPCVENEMERNGECVCVDGYARPADGAVCEEIPAALGGECTAAGDECDSDYPLCHSSDDGAGYCTNACSTSDECDGGYRCQEMGDEGYCRRPPVGYGDKCSSDDDCAGGDATYCEVFQENICLVPCSAGNTDVCFVGEVCCNFVLFEPICVPADACAPNGTVVE